MLFKEVSFKLIVMIIDSGYSSNARESTLYRALLLKKIKVVDTRREPGWPTTTVAKRMILTLLSD